MANILNQNEIDSLIGAIDNGDFEEEGNETASGQDISKYNFKRPNLLTKDQLRNFEGIHENLAKELSAGMALMLRHNSELSLVSTEQQQYNEFISSLAEETHIISLSIGDLPGIALMEVNLSLVFGIIDILLGGEGTVETEIKVPTDIETAVLHPFTDKIIKELDIAWNSLLDDIKIKKKGEFSSPEYVQAAPADAPVVVLAFDVKIGPVSGIINICYPMPLIQGVNEYLAGTSGQMDDYYGKKSDNASKGKALNALLNVPLPFNVNLGSTTIKGQELLNLKKGDVIVLDKKIIDFLTMSILNKPIYTGRPGRIKDSLVLKLNKPVYSKSINDFNIKMI